MKQETLVLKDEFLGTFYYVGRGDAPRQVNGESGKWVRHILMSEKHGEVHVITKETANVIKYDSEVKIIGGKLYVDFVNGRNFAPYLNVLAEKIEVVKGGN